MRAAYVRGRAPRPGPELDLVSAFLSDGLGVLGSREPWCAVEPEVALAYPDVVLAYRRESEPVPVPCADVGTEHFKILQHLRSLHGARLETLAADLNYPVRHARRFVQALVDAGYAYERGHTVRASSLSQTFPLTRIVSIEAKISNIGRAIAQAKQNTWFASHSYILVPESKVTPTVIGAAVHHGVGVLGQGRSRTRKHLHARRHPLPSSYASWMIGRWATCGATEVVEGARC